MSRLAVVAFSFFLMLSMSLRGNILQDSLVLTWENELQAASTDSLRAATFSKLFKYALVRDLKTAESYLLRADEEAWAKAKGCYHYTHLSDWAVLHDKQGLHAQAKEEFLENLRNMERIGCSSFFLFGTCHNLGLTLINLEDLEGAVYYFTKAAKYAEEVGYSKGRVATLNNLGMVYFKLGDYEKAREYYESSLELLRGEGSLASITSINLNLGNIYFILKEYDEALKIYKEVVRIAESLKDSTHISTRYMNMGLTYYAKGDLDSAVITLQKAAECARAISNPSQEIMVERNMANVLAAKGDYRGAIKKLKESLVYYKANSVTTEVMKIYALMAEYHAKLGNHSVAYDLQKQYSHLLDSTTQARREQELANQLAEFEVSKLEAEADSVEKALIISRQEGEIKDLKLSRYIFLLVGLAVLIVLGLILFIANLRSRKLREELRIAEFKHTALRARMDPHFLFNALNSIQNAILNRDKMIAYDYHTKFSELMRLVLMHSDQSFIRLDEEIRALKLYLQLEQLRTKDGFEYSIDISPEIEPSQQDFPSMLLQPFVENAIWHGVMNRETPGKIEIRIRKLQEEIRCDIEDNGIGRTAAMKYRKQDHKPVATNLVNDRISILKKQFGEMVSLKITDKENPDGTAAGTLIMITFPVNLSR